MRYDRRTFLKQGAAALIARHAAASVPGGTPWEWAHYGGDQAAARYAPLRQIHRGNVNELQPAWVHHTGDAMDRPLTNIECTPLCIDGVLYVTTAQLKLHALEAATGQLLWAFDPFEGQSRGRNRGVNRGVACWRDKGDIRVFFPAGHHLYCLDGKSGKLERSFGGEGRIDLKQHFDHDMSELSFVHSSPPAVYRDLVITGGGGGEGPYPAAPGHIRAWDVHTGRRRWIFHTTPHPGEYGYETWPKDSWKRNGGSNSWAGMSVDEKRGWVFVSTGSPAFDFYGGDRIGQNLFGNCVLALDANTGERMWHFQTVHHDLWDYDLPAQPMLCTAKRGGQTLETVVQLTKTGLTFVFDRDTGQPFFGVEERPVPPSDIPGEQAWPTQPFPLKPPPLSGLGFSEDDITGISPEAEAYVREIFEKSRSGPIFTPPSFEGTIVRPGFLGGALWGGGSFDPETNYLYVNTSENANLMALVEAGEDKPFRYSHKGYVRFFDHEGRAPTKPPWGFLTCIDMNEGEFVWREPLGEDPELAKKGVPTTGTRQLGGSIATSGGLVFVGSTLDEKFRAFDSKTGAELWSYKLNAGGYATPCTYESGGRQFVVIAAGGGSTQGTKAGDEFVAFALPS